MEFYPIYLCSGVPVGIQNNNPGNIWNNPNVHFPGEITPPGAQWKKFPSMPWGYQALMLNLQSYIKDGLDTLPEITHTWAPFGHGNNDPVKYAADLEDITGIPQNQRISASDIDSLKKIAYGISYIEQGVQPSLHEISAGAQLIGATPFSGTYNGSSANEKTSPLVTIGLAAIIAFAAYEYVIKPKMKKR